MLSNLAIEEISSHPAFDGLDKKELSEVNIHANEQLAVQSVGDQIQFGFKPFVAVESDFKKVLLSYEVAAVSDLSVLNNSSPEHEEVREKVIAASYKAFEILRLCPIPKSGFERLQFIFRISSLAYCGERWSDLRRWLTDNPTLFDETPKKQEPWDQYILSKLYFCWIRLFRKSSRQDLDLIIKTVSALYEEQTTREKQLFDQLDSDYHQNCAVRLLALYHWVKCTKIIAEYILNGGAKTNPFGHIDMHFERAIQAARLSGEWQIEYLLKWLHPTSRIMISNSLWWTLRSVNSKTTKFVELLTHRKHNPIFELLPTQQMAMEEGLLDPVKTAVVVDMPTSGGKTLLAQFKILHTLSNSVHENSWVAYITPTRALSSQITRRFRQDLNELGIVTEQLTGALDINAFENDLLDNAVNKFDILVTTPEKFYQVVRNNKISNQPPALVVLDEAHNIETEGRGLRIELLLATLKLEFPNTNFLLLMPYADGTKSIANWLAGNNKAGLPISMGTTPWQPNERIVGLFSAVPDNNARSDWHLEFETLEATEKAIALAGKFKIGGNKPIDLPRSKVVSKNKQQGLAYQTVAMSTTMAKNGTSIAIGQTIPTVWNMATKANEKLLKPKNIPPDIRLIQDFLRTEIGPEFELIDFLDKGIAVHHTGLSDEVRALVEWLAETGQLSVLCSTTTIAQGLNFPVSSVFLQSHKFPFGNEMSAREFWNLAGRAGRIGHNNIGIIGLAAGNDADKLRNFVQSKSKELVSQLVRLLDELEDNGKLDDLSKIIRGIEWEDFRNYLAYLWVEKKDLGAVQSTTEQVLRQTFGFTTLQKDSKLQFKVNALRIATENYINELAEMPSNIPVLSNQTGFSPEGVRSALFAINNLENRITKEDWTPETMFGNNGKLAELYGVMLEIPKLQRNLSEVGGAGYEKKKLANITNDWVNGLEISDIATKYFTDSDKDEDTTAKISKTFRAINKAIVNDGTWGISAITSFSGIDFEKISESEKRTINLIPAMIYHGVSSENAVLMRMNAIPRGIAEELGHEYGHSYKNVEEKSKVGSARHFLKSLSNKEWQDICPKNLAMAGKDYKRVWEILSGESNLSK